MARVTYRGFDLPDGTAVPDVPADLRTLVDGVFTNFGSVRAYQALMGAGPTVGANALTLATVNVPAQPRAHALEVCAAWVGYGDVANDSFMLAVRVNAVQVGSSQNRFSNFNMHSNFSVATSGFVAIAANTAAVVTAILSRVSGTGVCTQTTGTNPNYLTARSYGT